MRSPNRVTAAINASEPDVRPPHQQRREATFELDIEQVRQPGT
jgi:hypothetical protein